MLNVRTPYATRNSRLTPDGSAVLAFRLDTHRRAYLVMGQQGAGVLGRVRRQPVLAVVGCVVCADCLRRAPVVSNATGQDLARHVPGEPLVGMVATELARA